MIYNILITGSNTGLGKALAEKFSKEKHNVFKHQGSKHYDLTDLQKIEELKNLAIEKNINVLINNAAVVCPNITFDKYNIEKINSMIDVNLRAPIILTYSLYPHLTDIININSMVGLEIKSPRTLYSATKWGLRGFSNSLKKESKNVNILDVYPTNIKTTPEKKNSMDINMVVNSIYDAFIKKEQILVLDGRPK